MRGGDARIIFLSLSTLVYLRKNPLHPLLENYINFSFDKLPHFLYILSYVVLEGRYNKIGIKVLLFRFIILLAY